MGPPFSTELLDEALRRKRDLQESERKGKLQEVFSVLDMFEKFFSFKEIYLFGSLNRAGHFAPESDFDIAVEGLAIEDFVPALSFLSSKLGRDVDLICLENCRFRDKILKEGIRWKKQK